MSTPERTFQDLGLDAITGVELMDSLGVSLMDVSIPQRFHRLHAVIDFLKQFPEDTRRFLISKAVRGKSVDKLDHMFEYVNLLQSKKMYEDILGNIEKEHSVMEFSADSMKLSEIVARSTDARSKLNQINEEITIYEK